MPRLSTIRLEPLRDLVADLRYTPRAALLRCIERAESLALELDPQTTYPMEWVIYRVTGYRPKDAPDALLPGDALLADLSSLVEHLCEVAAFRDEEAEPDAATIDQLAERWSVSRKSIERYRRQGLIARRTRGLDGNVRLVFCTRVVDHFEEQRADHLERAASFDRVGNQERDWLYRRARRYHASLGWEFPKIARRLADRSRRNLGTMRRSLVLADQLSGDPVFCIRKNLDERQARTITRAMEWGIKPGLLAERFGRSRTSILRIAIDGRAAALRRHAQTIRRQHDIPSQTIHNSAAHILQQPGATDCAIENPPLEARALLSWASQLNPVDARWESQTSAAHWLLLARAAETIDGLANSMVLAGEVDAIETDLRWALLLRRRLVISQIPLMIRTMQDRLGTNLLTLRPDQIKTLFRVAMHATILAVDGSHPQRPDRSLTDFGRLASPVSLALNRALSQHRPEHFEAATGRAATARAELEDWTRLLAPWQALVEPHPMIALSLDRLQEPDRSILTLRYGLGGKPPLSSAAIGEQLGVSPARIASASRRARHAARQPSTS